MGTIRMLSWSGVLAACKKSAGATMPVKWQGTWRTGDRRVSFQCPTQGGPPPNRGHVHSARTAMFSPDARPHHNFELRPQCRTRKTGPSSNRCTVPHPVLVSLECGDSFRCAPPPRVRSSNGALAPRREGVASALQTKKSGDQQAHDPENRDNPEDKKK